MRLRSGFHDPAGRITLGPSRVRMLPLLQDNTIVTHGTITFSAAGPYSWTNTYGVTTVSVVAWGSGGVGGGSSGTQGGGGGGGGEYAANPTVGITQGTTYSGSVGAIGTQSSFVGDSVSVIAIGGSVGGTGTTVAGAGGSGGTGGTGTSLANGTTGSNGVITAGGAGGAGGNNGGSGGSGGTVGNPGSSGVAPGGGGGGGGASSGGSSGVGRVTLTW